MSYTAHEEELKGFTLKIQSDEDAESPREWDNLGTMVCFHRRYNLGDKHDYRDVEHFFTSLWNQEATEEEKRKFILEACKGSIAKFREVLEHSYDYTVNSLFETTVDRIKAVESFPDSVIHLNLYLYDHSGITMNTGGFSCPWDSGQVGIIYVTKSKLEKEGLSERTEDEIRKYLDGEVETYDKYLTGDVYGFVITKANTCDCCHHVENEVLESCWGFFGQEDAIAEGKSMIEYLAKE